MARITAYVALLAFSAIITHSPVSANVINDAVDAVEDAYDTTASWVDGAADTVGSAAEDAYDAVASATGSIVDDVSTAHTLAVSSAIVLVTTVLTVGFI